YIPRLGAVDIDRAGQGVRSTAGIGFAQLDDLLHGRSRLDLVVRMHHGLDRDRVARVDGEFGLLARIEPTPLHRIDADGERLTLARRTPGGPVMVATRGGLLLR